MEIIDIKNYPNYLNEYIKLCSLEWGKKRTTDELEKYIISKIEKIKNEDKVISVIGLIDNDILIGFISLFKYDGEERNDLTPWYSTMYVKKEYRNKGFSKILNASILNKANELGYDKVYLKSNLINYYEKFGAKFIEKLNTGENLYYIDIKESL